MAEGKLADAAIRTIFAGIIRIIASFTAGMDARRQIPHRTTLSISAREQATATITRPLRAIVELPHSGQYPEVNP